MRLKDVPTGKKFHFIGFPLDVAIVVEHGKEETKVLEVFAGEKVSSMYSSDRDVVYPIIEQIELFEIQSSPKTPKVWQHALRTTR